MKIMFNHQYGLHEATIKGTKTQTRRIASTKLIAEYSEWYTSVACNHTQTCKKETLEEFMLRKVPYQVGQIISIGESYCDIYNRLLFSGQKEKALAFKAQLGDMPELLAGWKNKMFVKEMYMLRAILVDAVRFQHLQDITDDECLAEGILDEPGLGRGQFHYGFYTGSTIGARGNKTSSVWYETPKKPMLN